MPKGRSPADTPGLEGSPPAAAPFMRPEDLLGDLRGDLILEKLAAEKIERRLAARREHRRKRYAAQREAAGKGPVNPHMGAPRKDPEGCPEVCAPVSLDRGPEASGLEFPGFAPDPAPAPAATSSPSPPHRPGSGSGTVRQDAPRVPADTTGRRIPLRFSVDAWMGDRGLRACSAAARGIWIDLLCIMHRAAPYGTLRTPLGNAYELPMLARVLEVRVSELKPLMKELEISGVFALDDEGVPYSRRMRRELESALYWRALQKHSAKLAHLERAALLHANESLIDTILPSEAEALARRGARRRGGSLNLPTQSPGPARTATVATAARSAPRERSTQPIVVPSFIPADSGCVGEWAVEGFGDGFGAEFGADAGVQAESGQIGDASSAAAVVVLPHERAHAPAEDAHLSARREEPARCDAAAPCATLQTPSVHAALAPSLGAEAGEDGLPPAREQMPLFVGSEDAAPVPPLGLGDRQQFSDGSIPECPVVEIVTLFNQIMKGSDVALIADPVRFADHRDGHHLRVRWREMFGRETGTELLRPYASVRQGVESWRGLFMGLLGSDFLMNRAPRGEKHKRWKFGLRWMVTSPSNFQKILEGTYHSMGGVSAIAPGLKRFMESYPRHRLSDPDEMREPWEDLQLEGLHEQVLSNLEAWKTSDQWMREGGRYVPKSAKFLLQGLYETSPASGASLVPQVVVEANGERYLDAKAAARRIAMRDVAQWRGPPKRSGDWRYLRFENGFWIAGTGEVFTDDYLAKAQSEFARTFMKEMAAHGDPVNVERAALHPYVEAELRVREGRLDPLAVGDPDYKALYEWADRVLGTLDEWMVRAEGHAAQQADPGI